MAKLLRIRAEKLFGYLDQDIELASGEGVTILHGANGSGKTTLLRCLEDVSEGRWSSLLARPLSKLSLDFDGGGVFELSKFASDKVVTFSHRPSKGKRTVRWQIEKRVFDHFRGMMDRDPFILQEYWAMKRKMRPPTAEELFGVTSSDLWPLVGRVFPDASPPPDWLTGFKSVFDCTLIEEQRLVKYTTQDGDKSPKPKRAVAEFSKDIVAAIKDVSSKYGEKSQQLDSTFPQRLVNVLATTPPDAPKLQEKFNELEALRGRLEQADLIGPDASMMRLEPSSLDKAEVRRLLSLYADDVASKLSLFDSIYKKISLFEELIEVYFSRKKAKTSKQGITIHSDVDGSELQPTDLSSGEQHIFVLFFRLIFTEHSGQHLVLIDEPELSLHPRWQLRFVDDLERIRLLSPLDFILASHSPQIFQGHMHLGRDLKI